MMKIGVIGAGSMGRGIAQHAAQHGHEVVLVDIIEDTLTNAFAFIQKMLNRSVEKGRITDLEAKESISRIFCSTYISAVEDCGLVIEAVVEKLSLKQGIFREIESHVSPEAILASNTSSLSITQLAGGLQHPERMIGIHFFNPVPLMKLVEIIPAMQTDPKYVDTCSSMIDAWMKYPVKAKDTPGFIVNKVARPFYSEALRIYEEGIANFSEIDQAMTEIGGFRMGPFTLMDYIGNDVNYAVTESVFKAFYYDPRYKPSFTQKRLTEAGWLGRKSGKGYYDYEDGKQVTNAVDSPKKLEIFERILVMLINEAADTLQMGIASLKDIDIAVTKGVNYPKGLFTWADEIGISKVVEKLDALYEFYHEDRYRTSAVLRNKLKDGSTFYGEIS
ncbi:3-hydroxyacyl-CoA dehydrogenase NAD-binding domain-containing protein [Saprospiraceae bacterium]|nr:3-hydroxyacyl-CoA dehydrogenase NAD-binding domain-containing protein [Saprospiraceae bacterium]